MTNYRNRVNAQLDLKKAENQKKEVKQTNLAKRREKRHADAILKNKELLTKLGQLLIASDGKEIKLSDTRLGASAVYYDSNRTVKDGTYILKDGSTLMVNKGKLLLHNK